MRRFEDQHGGCNHGDGGENSAPPQDWREGPGCSVSGDAEVSGRWWCSQYDDLAAFGAVAKMPQDRVTLAPRKAVFYESGEQVEIGMSGIRVLPEPSTDRFRQLNQRLFLPLPGTHDLLVRERRERGILR